MPKIGQWLEQHFVLTRTVREDGEEVRYFLDPNGYAAWELYEAAYYGSTEEANAAKSNQKAEGKYSAAPLLWFLRDVSERKAELDRT